MSSQHIIQLDLFIQVAGTCLEAPDRMVALTTASSPWPTDGISGNFLSCVLDDTVVANVPMYDWKAFTRVSFLGRWLCCKQREVSNLLKQFLFSIRSDNFFVEKVFSSSAERDGVRERERERISVAQCSWNANTELEQSITILLQKGTFFLSLERASKKDNVVVFLLISQSENISVRLKQFVLRDQLNTNFI